MRYLNAVVPALLSKKKIIKLNKSHDYSTSKQLNKIMYTKSHEYIDKEEGKSIGKVGISKYASEHIGEIIFAEMMDDDEAVEKGSIIGVLESVKSANDIYAPINCVILEKNRKVIDDPNIISRDPKREGWIFKVSCNSLHDNELMNSEEYDKYVEEEKNK
jgi:glycine cleavage system H protein